MKITLLGVLAAIGVVALILFVAEQLSKADQPRVELNEPSNASEGSGTTGNQNIL
jgi:hypothetical protein